MRMCKTYLVISLALLAGCSKVQSNAAGTATPIQSDVKAALLEKNLISTGRGDVPRGDAAGQIVLTKEISGTPPTVVSVKYLDREEGDAVCVLQISEGDSVVAENGNIVECGLLQSPDMIELDISGDADGLKVFQQKTRENNTFFLQRSDGGWVVTKVVFVYPRDNPDTGDFEVLREVADLRAKKATVSVSQYEHGKIEKSLVRSVIE